jgi:hypothetical protein
VKGKLSAKTRRFEQVVSDLKNTVFSVVRHRPEGAGVQAISLGSGFFVSPKVFLTCYHVVNNTLNPHKDGDTYHLVNNLTDSADKKGGVIHETKGVTAGKKLHLYPDADLALFVLDGIAAQDYVTLDYGFVQQGADIGIAGYPLPKLVAINDQLRYDGLLYRVARGTVTATYNAPLAAKEIPSNSVVPLIEVNFLFVPGNSGGPIFRADNGGVIGYVHGFRHAPIVQKHSQAAAHVALPDGMSRDYVENVHAVYSIGIRIECAKQSLQSFGVSV